MKECVSIKQVFLFAVVFTGGAGLLFAGDTSSKGKKVTETQLEGFFVRVKSGVTGEKQLYYNKDGSLRSSLGDGLLDGSFSLDENLFAGGDELDLSLSSPQSAAPLEKSVSSGPSTRLEPPSSATSKKDAVSEKPTERKRVVEEGVVDENATLKKFSREKKDFGLSENFKKIVNMDANERYRETLSLREWQGSTAYGMRRALGLDRDYEMSGFALGEKSVSMGLFDTRSNLAGERMFVRNREGLFEVRLSERFSSADVRANERVKNLRESSGFSMQDINRYQFRRNRSSDPGLPVVSPNSGGNVRKETLGGNVRN